MAKLNWDYVTVVHSDDDFGRQSLQVYKRLQTKYFICSAETIPVGYANVSQVNVDTAGAVYIGSKGVGQYYQIFPMLYTRFFCAKAQKFSVPHFLICLCLCFLLLVNT